MQLVTLNYIEYENTDAEWKLRNLELGRVNLIVGKNASGKSRCVNLVNNLALILRGQLASRNSGYDVTFSGDSESLRYKLSIEEFNVVSESLYRNGDNTPLISRAADGYGNIFYEKEGKATEFKLPQNQIAAVVRQDSLQHSFLSPIRAWAESVYYYPFGSDMGKTNFAAITTELAIQFDFHDFRQVLAVFRRGVAAFGDHFKNCVIEDMEKVDYAIDSIELATPTSFSIQAFPPGPSPNIVGVVVREKGLRAPVDQFAMSQGMYRALATIIHLTYGRLTGRASCILIDDIGEGLDFERSKQLIDVVIHRARSSDTQVVMTTNDRFVMNGVPLEYWSVLRRTGQEVNVRNFNNSRDRFEEFKYTGLNNFDFFATDFLS